MIGYLIYDQIGADRNEWFINEFIKTSKNYGVELILKIIKKVEDIYNSPLPDFAIIRTINPKINNYFESKGVQTFNNFETSKIANDKFATYTLCKELNIPVMKTSLLSAKAPDINYPFVIKSRDGHGGSEVFLINSEKDLNNKLAHVNKDNFIAQEFCSNPGVDMRVYVLGDKIVLSAVRKSHTDFRSNFSLGGSVSVGKVEPYQIEVINKLRRALNFDLVGVDFIYHNGKWVLNEIEDVVGTRMLYKLTDINVVDLYLNYIIKKRKD